MFRSAIVLGFVCAVSSTNAFGGPEPKPPPGPKPGPGPDENPGLEIIIGLSEGLFNDRTLSDCIENVVETVPSVTSAIEELTSALKSKNPFKITKAVKDVRKVLQGVPQALEDCGANIDDVKNLLEALKETVPLIVGEVVSAKQSLDEGDYEGFGYHFGKALSDLAAGDGPGPQPKPGPGPKPGPSKGNPALEIIEGLSEGLFDDDTLGTCVAGVLENAPAAASALKELTQALHTKNPFKIRKAIKDVIKVAKSIPDTFSACLSNVDDVKALLETLEDIIPPLVGDIVSAQQSLKVRDYEDFGEYLGKALRMVIYSDGPGPHMDDVVV